MWLASTSSPAALSSTVRQLEQAQDPGGASSAAREKARAEIAVCDAKLRAHRAALEAGADPAIVAGWVSRLLWIRARRFHPFGLRFGQHREHCP